MKKIILLLSMMAFSSAGADYVKVEAKITDDKYSSKTQSIVASRGKTYSAGQFVSVGLGHVVYIEDNAPVKPDYGFIDVAGRHNINKNTHVSGSLQRYDDSAMTYDLTLQYTADEYKYAFGAFTERGRIDSYAGLSKGLFGVLYGVSADYMVTQQWSVTGVYYTDRKSVV